MSLAQVKYARNTMIKMILLLVVLTLFTTTVYGGSVYADGHDIKATPTPHLEYEQSIQRVENDARRAARMSQRSGCSGALGSTGSIDIGLILVLSVCPLLISRAKICK